MVSIHVCFRLCSISCYIFFSTLIGNYTVLCHVCVRSEFDASQRVIRAHKLKAKRNHFNWSVNYIAHCINGGQSGGELTKKFPFRFQFFLSSSSLLFMRMRSETTRFIKVTEIELRTSSVLIHKTFANGSSSSNYKCSICCGCWSSCLGFC